MTEESTTYDAPDPRATIADRLFADVTTDAEKALRLLQDGDPELFVCEDDEYPLVWDASRYTVANELMRLKGYDGPADAWRKLGFVWWVENKLRPAMCKTMTDVLAQYEEGGEPDYVRD